MADAKKPAPPKSVKPAPPKGSGGNGKKDEAAVKSLGKGIGELQRDVAELVKVSAKASGDPKAMGAVGKLLDGIVKAALELKKEAASASK